jgi:hypothetical protein
MGHVQHARSRSQGRNPAAHPHMKASGARRVLRDNGLSIVLLALFVGFVIGQSLVGHAEYISEQESHGLGAVGYWQYLLSPHFLEATTENWESEFLQMFGYVLLTAMLFQRGSAESKDPDKPEPVDRDPSTSADKADAPSPVRRGGLVLKLYENSLSLAFLLLFLVSFVLHAASGAREYSSDQLAHGEPAVSTLAYLGTSRFWFESLQNWQSEFLAIAAMVLLTIHLRQRGSPESKPVDAPHSQTGGG